MYNVIENNLLIEIETSQLEEILEFGSGSASCGGSGLAEANCWPIRENNQIATDSHMAVTDE